MISPKAERTILVPLDGSSFAEQALPLAVSLALTTRSRIVLALVQHIPYWPDEVANPESLATIKQLLHAEDETYLRSARQRFQPPGLSMDTIALPADLPIGLVLSQFVQDTGVGMVVMATHGRGGLERAWLGSVADYLLRHLLVPVILARPGVAPPSQGRRILVPLDGSPLAESVLEEACALAIAGNHEITLLQVVPPVLQTIGALESPYIGFDEKLTTIHQSEAEDYLDDIEEQVRARGIKCLGLTLLAPNPAACILEVARPADFALIAMASHGRGGLRRIVLGSVADKVVRGAEVPVLVHRPVGSTAADAIPAAHARMAGPRSCVL